MIVNFPVATLKKLKKKKPHSITYFNNTNTNVSFEQFLKFIYFWEREQGEAEKARERETETETESQAGSTLSAQSPTWGLDSGTVRL